MHSTKEIKCVCLFLQPTRGWDMPVLAAKETESLLYRCLLPRAHQVSTLWLGWLQVAQGGQEGF